ncbi:MAG: TRAP transporter small permease [Pseudomonadota bacterium]
MNQRQDETNRASSVSGTAQGKDKRGWPYRIIDKIADGLLAVSRVVGYAGLVMSCVAIVGIVLLLSVSALVRYVFSTPIPFTEDLSGLLFVIVFTASIAHATNEGGHFRLMLLWNKLSPRMRGVTLILGDMMTLIAFSIIASVTWEFADFSRMLNSRSDFGDILLWPWMMVIPVAIACFCFAILVRIFDVLRLLINGRTVETKTVSFH